MKATQDSTRLTDERHWSPGSFVAAGFALSIFLYSMITALLSLSWPTDGWIITGDLNVDAPQMILTQHFLTDPTHLREGDQVLEINGQSVLQLQEAQHTFFRLVPPDWPDGTQLGYEILRAGQHLSIDVPVRRASLWEFYSGYLGTGLSSANLVQFITGLLFFIIGIFVFLKRPSNRAAHALLFIGIGFFPWIENYTTPTLFYPRPPVSIPFDSWTLMINPSLMYLALAFPHPKAPLRRFPHLTVLLLYLSWPLVFNTAYLLNLEDWRGYQDIAFAIYPAQVVLMMLVTLIALVHSGLTVRDPVGRSQLKWMLAGIISFVFIGVGGWLVSSYLFPETMATGNWLITTIGWLILPVCLAIAITRYHLFDIDVIIRKTLLYGALTVLLGLVYFGVVTLLGSLFSAISGQQSAIAIVISTLAIAALFNPLRKRIQEFIDRRFYRRKYDAEQALAEFAVTARDEVDADVLTSKLVGVVEETIQPVKVSILLKKTDD